MEISTVGQDYGIQRSGGGVLVAGRQTSAQTFAAPVGDGQVAVGRVEEHVTVAIHEDETGNQHAVYQVARRFRLIGLSPMRSIRHSVGYSAEPTQTQTQTQTQDEEEGMDAGTRVCGVMNVHACPDDKRLAIYIIVQGAAASLNAASVTLMFCCACKCTLYNVYTFPLIYLFNVIWSGIGFWWLDTCSDNFLHHLTWGFTIPLLIPVLLLCCCCYLYCRSDD